MVRITRALAALAALTVLAACQARGDGQKIGGDVSVQRLTDADGKLVCSLIWEEVWIRIAGSAGEPLGTAVARGKGTVVLTDATGHEDVESVISTEDGVEIREHGARKFRLVKDASGNWSLEDAAQGRVAACVRTGEGWEVRGAPGDAPILVRKSGGKAVFGAAGGKPRYELDRFDGSDLECVMWLALERLSLPERAALYKFFVSWR